MNKKVLLGISGGVDSTIAALLLKQQGYEVIGAFMKNFSETKSKLTGECSWREEKRMAQRICAQLNIPLLTIDGEEEYTNKVLSPMFKQYSKGRTPNPDIGCNTQIKFPLLLKKAKKLNCNFIATGHYAKIKKSFGSYGTFGCSRNTNKKSHKFLDIRKQGNSYLLQRGKDETKDQSYFLYQLPSKVLAKTLFPVGNLTKEEVRALAEKNNFPNYNKQSSRGICFVGKVPMQEFLKQKIEENSGLVLSPERKVLGTHKGLAFYTRGQRIGPRIGINFNEQAKHLTNQKWFVAKKEKNNILIIAPENHPSLLTKDVSITNFKTNLNKSSIPKSLKARYRHLGQIISGNLSFSKNKVKFIFNKPQKGIATGQHIVFYKGKTLIAGGIMHDSP